MRVYPNTERNFHAAFSRLGKLAIFCVLCYSLQQWQLYVKRRILMKRANFYLTEKQMERPFIPRMNDGGFLGRFL